MISLWNLIISSGVSWAVGKALDVIVDCIGCGQRNNQRIKNTAWNHLYCQNCQKENLQFTNICNTTVNRNGEIGSVAIALSKNWTVKIDPSDKSWLFKKKWDDYIFFLYKGRTLAMLNTDIVLKGVLSDYNTNQIYTDFEVILTPNYHDCLYGEDNTARMHFNWKDIPEDKRDNRIFAIDTIVQSRYGDKLTEDRILTNLWE